MKKKVVAKKPIKKASTAKKPVKKSPPSPKKTRNKTTAPKKHLKTTATSKTVIAEVLDEDSIAPDMSTDLNSELNKAYAIPNERELEEELGIDQEPEETTTTSSKAESSSDFLPATVNKALAPSDPLAIYLADVRKYPVLTREEEQKVAKKYFETKDPEAAQILVKSNLRFVVKIAAEYSKFGAKMIDLIQEGNVGLMHAVREFNPYKGTRLITYAVWWIRGYIQEYLMRQYSMVRIGTTQNQRKLFYQLQKQKETLEALGQEPDLALLSSRLGIPEEEVTQMAQRMSGRDVSLDRPLDEDSSGTLLDFQKSPAESNLDDQLARAEQLEILKQKIEEIRPELSEREKIILDERLLNEDPLTLQEIGEKHGITREAVRQMEARVMKKIKAKMEEK